MSVTTMPAKKEAAANGEAAGGKKKKLVMILALVLVIGGGGYWFFVKPKGDGKPQPGVVIKLDPIQVNLAAGHYLKLGIALQLTTAVKEEDGSKALDAAIDLFSGRPMEQLARTSDRNALKTQLEKTLAKRYDGEVMGVYFTDFVTQ